MDTIHEHEIDVKVHKYNMFTAINIDNYPRKLCVDLRQLCVWTYADGVHALCTHTRCHRAQSVEKCHILYEVCANKQI